MTPRRLLPALGALAVVVAAVVLVVSAVETSTARLTASTSGGGFFSAGTVVIDQPGVAVDLLFDADLLVPEQVSSGCVVVEYRGSIPAGVHLHGRLLGGTGLEEFVEVRFTELRDDRCPDVVDGDGRPVAADPVSGRYSGRLDAFLTDHGNHDEGLVLDAGAEAGDRFVVWAEAWLVDDNRAQGRSTEFAVVLEARP
ncbi:MAG: hypothetical protein AAF962_18820 [Actinomycetota bacterium]